MEEEQYDLTKFNLEDRLFDVDMPYNKEEDFCYQTNKYCYNSYYRNNLTTGETFATSEEFSSFQLKSRMEQHEEDEKEINHNLEEISQPEEFELGQQFQQEAESIPQQTDDVEIEVEEEVGLEVSLAMADIEEEWNVEVLEAMAYAEEGESQSLGVETVNMGIDLSTASFEANCLFTSPSMYVCRKRPFRIEKIIKRNVRQQNIKQATGRTFRHSMFIKYLPEHYDNVLRKFNVRLFKNLGRIATLEMRTIVDKILKKKDTHYEEKALTIGFSQYLVKEVKKENVRLFHSSSLEDLLVINYREICKIRSVEKKPGNAGDDWKSPEKRLAEANKKAIKLFKAHSDGNRYLECSLRTYIERLINSDHCSVEVKLFVSAFFRKYKIPVKADENIYEKFVNEYFFYFSDAREVPLQTLNGV
jgi:hypothetical protein